MPEEDFNFDLDEGIMDEDANWYLEEDEGYRPTVLSMFGNQSVYSKYENSSTIGAYDCDRNLVALNCSIEENKSSASMEIVDITKTKVSDYDGDQGIDFDAYTKGRQFVLIASEEDIDNEDLPEDGDPYANDKQVIFSGYNYSGATLDLSTIRYTSEFIGVEHLLNEIKISGCLIGGLASPSGANPGDRLSNSRCIFNENSRPDRQRNLGSGATDTTYRFNKSGIGNTAYWEIQEILKYVVNFYCVSTSPLIALDTNGMGLKMITYVSNYIYWQWGQISSFDLINLRPMDFVLEGMGVFDALLKIVAETKKYMIYKSYTTQGKCSLGVRIKYAHVDEREAGDLPMVIDIGQLKAVAASNNIMESATINLNRETKNIGRVIVLGDYLRINTLCTTIDYPEFDGQFSTVKDSYSATTGLTAFLDRISLVLTDTPSTEPYQQIYSAVPINMLNITLADIGFDPTVYNNEPTTLKIFEGIKCLDISREFSKGETLDSTKSVRDISIYIANPEARAGVDDADVYYNYPERLVDEESYYFISPMEDLTNGFGAKHQDGEHSSLIVYESNGDKDNDTGLTEFGQYQLKSRMSHSDIAYGFFPNYNITKPIPMFARLNVRTDYRIKGISMIDGYDENIHSTVIVTDEDFKLTAQYKDAVYSSGEFNDNTDGYINADDVNVLAKIQEKSDAILEKYLVKQNSGKAGLEGFQFIFKNGDWLDKITGASRDINTPLVVSGVSLDFEKKKTELRFGS